MARASARLRLTTARLAAVGLGAAALVAPAAVMSTASAAVSPLGSCADVLAATPGAPDGEYQITAAGHTLDVYCHDMAGTPREFLTLPSGGATNFSQGRMDAAPTSLAETQWTRLAITLPATPTDVFTVDTADVTFATDTGPAGGQPNYGAAGSCQWAWSELSVDLLGTSFAVEQASFPYVGWLPGGDFTVSNGGQVLTVTNGRGDCGGVQAINPLPLVWLGGIAPVVTGPSDTTVTSGDTASFSASAEGDGPLTVQWQTSTDGTTWTDLPGATTDLLDLDAVTYAENGLQVRAVYTNAEGAVPSATATLTVEATTAFFTTDPSDVSALVGDTATFTVAVDGDPTPTLQWQGSPDGGATWLDLDGETGTDLVIADLTLDDDGILVRALATNPAGEVVSGEALLTVAAIAPTVTAEPTSVTVAEGGDATFTVAVSGTPQPDIQWQVLSADGSLWADIAGATGTTLTLNDVTAAQNGTVYRAFVSNDGGAVATTSVTLTVTVVAPPVTPVTVTTVAAPAPASTALAATGSNPAGLVAAALGLLAVGATAVVGARRTRTTV